MAYKLSFQFSHEYSCKIFVISSDENIEKALILFFTSLYQLILLSFFHILNSALGECETEVD